jgi:hypothetical protein
VSATPIAIGVTTSGKKFKKLNRFKRFNKLVTLLKPVKLFERVEPFKLNLGCKCRTFSYKK